MDFYDDILGIDDDKELSGFTFTFQSNFRIIDCDNGFYVDFHKLFKRSYKGYEKETETITSNLIDVKNVSHIELSEFKMNKLYKGIFFINYYEDDTFDIFLKSDCIL
jgi:transposase